MVELEIYPERLDEFVAGIGANSRASRSEKGCLRFDVQHDLQIPVKFHFYEIYTDEDAFRIHHRQAPHYAEWQNVVARCVVPGTQHNTYAEPLFPQDIPEAAQPDRAQGLLPNTVGQR
ncbi:hypothetical protein AFM11_33640 [Mycolicibacterium wolinskyi]|uniref:ABM domain-containing protein n=2 Tax=Mycolicibacterium wolinskyi TaxID=59750 RepID=A0A132PBZ3_9MYCO|nr:hypothetical protein AFM11_33640 [Mycolicibacterium wolinskyi]